MTRTQGGMKPQLSREHAAGSGTEMKSCDHMRELEITLKSV